MVDRSCFAAYEVIDLSCPVNEWKVFDAATGDEGERVTARTREQSALYALLDVGVAKMMGKSRDYTRDKRQKTRERVVWLE